MLKYKVKDWFERVNNFGSRPLVTMCCVLILLSGIVHLRYKLDAVTASKTVFVDRPVVKTITKTLVVYKDGKGYTTNQNLFLDCISVSRPTARTQTEMNEVIDQCQMSIRRL